MLDVDDPDAMAAYIEAAERYFRDLPAPERLFPKPIVPIEHAGYNVMRLGYLLHHLDHHRLHTVLDFGAGMCWLTIALARTGCRVVALDVSPSALAHGAEAIRRADLPPEVPPPTLLTYDGFRIPLPDASVDRVACFDALHHVPNKRTVLREMHRILRRGGRACFVEPGPGHAASKEARDDAAEWGVLEDEIDAPALCALAGEVGFASSYIVPLPQPADARLTAEQFQQLREGSRNAVLDWHGNDALIVLSRLPDGHTDSRSPRTLKARIEVTGSPIAVEPGAVFSAAVRVTNVGDTIWLASGRPPDLDYASEFLSDAAAAHARTTAASVEGYRSSIVHNDLEGMVTVGAQLWPVGGGQALAIDYGRGFFESDVPPGATAPADVQLRAPSEPGVYAVRLDGVAEGVTWFAARGSESTCVYVRVGDRLPPDSRAPGGLAARIEVVSRPGPNLLLVSITNIGDTIWLAHPLERGGWVRLGVQRLDHDGRVVERDWRRVPLPTDVVPGATTVVAVDVSGVAADGHVRLDLVDEWIAWFEDRGSQPLTMPIT